MTRGCFGKFQRTLDEKGRVIIPPNFRKKLDEEGFYLAFGPKNQLVVYTYEEWESYFERFMNENEEDDEAFVREMERAETVMDAKCDSQGRLCIPQEYRDYAHLELNEDILVIGIGNRIEIWDQKWHVEYKEQVKNV